MVEWIFMQEIWQPANSLIAAGYIREGLRFMLISMERTSAITGSWLH